MPLPPPGVVEDKGGGLNLCRILSEVPKVAKTREGEKAEGGGKRQLIPLISILSLNKGRFG